MSITTSEQTDKLIPALVEARKSITPAGKSGKNTFDKYAYAQELDWDRAVTPAILGQGLVLTFSAVDFSNLDDRTTKKGGKEHAVQVRGQARLTHVSGQWIQVCGAGEGQDRADKAIYKALTGMKKYLFALMFALPTTDDPEGDQTVGESEGNPTSTPDAIAAAQADLRTKWHTALKGAKNPAAFNALMVTVLEFHDLQLRSDVFNLALKVPKTRAGVMGIQGPIQGSPMSTDEQAEYLERVGKRFDEMPPPEEKKDAVQQGQGSQ